MTELSENYAHYVSLSCAEELCWICKLDATHKIEEVIQHDDFERRGFHPLTNYLCCVHFALVMGPAAEQHCQVELDV